MIYIVFLINLALFTVLGLVAFGNGAGPAGLQPAQAPVRPASNSLAHLAGPFGVFGFIWGFFWLFFFIITIEAFGAAPLSRLLNLVGILVLIVTATLAGYASVSAFFGAPVSGAGKVVEWIKRSFGGAESIFGLLALIFAIWTLVEFILNRSGVYI